MGWDVVGGLRDAAAWVNDKKEAALDAAGQAIDSAVHTAEGAVDDARKAIVDFGEQHGGVVGKAVAQNVSDGIGLVEGAGLAVYDAASGVATIARGVDHLTSPVEWALHPERNLERAQTAGNALSAMAQLGSPTAWALNTQENVNTAKAMWNGVTAGYQDAAKSGDWSKFGGRAVVDVGSFFIGAGEANAAVKGAQGANAAVHAAQGLNAAGHAAEGLSGAARAAKGLNGAAHGAEGVNAAAHGAEGLGGAARVADGASDAAHGADAAADAARGAHAAEIVTDVSVTQGRNTATFTLDAEGHTLSGKATFREVFEKAPRSSAEKGAQLATGARGEAADVGGHIFGHRFLKDQGEINMFPQNTQFNNSAYRTLENEWAGWVRQGNVVEVEVSFSGGTRARPDRINVYYEVTNPATGEKFTNAKPFRNEAGQTFDRVPSKDMKDMLP